MDVNPAEQNASAMSPSGEQANYQARISDELVLKQPELNLRPLPKECGVALIGFGIVGVMLLDPFDIVFVFAGALVFTPRLFQRTEGWMQARFPRFHREGRRHIDRFLDDFERRYPPALQMPAIH